MTRSFTIFINIIPNHRNSITMTTLVQSMKAKGSKLSDKSLIASPHLLWPIDPNCSTRPNVHSYTIPYSMASIPTCYWLIRQVALQTKRSIHQMNFYKSGSYDAAGHSISWMSYVSFNTAGRQKTYKKCSIVFHENFCKIDIIYICNRDDNNCRRLGR